MSISTPLAVCNSNTTRWLMVDALMGGTETMREAGETYMPKWPNEDPDEYETRLQVSTLLPAYRETVSNMTGRVFAENVEFKEDVPEQVETWCENIDRQGNRFDVWGQMFFSEGLAYGINFALVDKPRSDAKTRADEIKLGVRPYVNRINPKQIIGWRTKETENGFELSQLRIKEKITIEDGSYGVKEIDQIRLLTPGHVQLWRKDLEGADLLHEEWDTGLNKIPLVVYYTNQTGFMTGKPALMDLAYMNVKHWQSQSDQDNLLHVARVPILFLKGFDDNDKITVGSMALKGGASTDAKYVEHSGSAIGAGQSSLDALEDQMRKAGAKLLSKDSQAAKTATQADNEKAEDLCALATMAQSLEDALNNILQLMAEWMGLGNGGHVSVNSDFELDEQDINPNLINAVVAAWQAGALRKEAMVKTWQEIGLEDETLDAQDIIDELENETPGLTGALNNATNTQGRGDPNSVNSGTSESGGATTTDKAA